MLRINEKQLVELAVQGKVSPAIEYAPFEISHKGELFPVPSTGTIVYNVKVGDPAFGWKADHVEPGVSTVCTDSDRSAQKGYNFLPCLGNKVTVISGDAKGAKGVVTGKHGGVDHVIIDFPDKTLASLALDDKFLIRAFGQGLELLDYPEIHVFNFDPKVLKKMKIRASKKSLEVGVTTIVPAQLMGSGIGSLAPARGDFDITAHDEKDVKKYKLDKIRLGDFVAIEDYDSRYGRAYKSGATTIGIVIHANSYLAGHGPGVMTLLTTEKSGTLRPFYDPRANIAEMLKIGSYRKNNLSS